MIEYVNVVKLIVSTMMLIMSPSASWASSQKHGHSGGCHPALRGCKYPRLLNMAQRDKMLETLEKEDNSTTICSLKN